MDIVDKTAKKAESRRNEVVKISSYMKINTVNKLDRSLLLGMPVETTGGQICENILQEWTRIVDPSSFVYSKRT